MAPPDERSQAKKDVPPVLAGGCVGGNDHRTAWFTPIRRPTPRRRFYPVDSGCPAILRKFFDTTGETNKFAAHLTRQKILF
jgi:hypothetical protein